MKRNYGFLILMLVLAATKLFGHHSFAAEYDNNSPVKLQGSVKLLEWTNPHARLYVDVTDQRGQVTTWNFELGSPNQLKRMGWSREALHTGDTITVEGYRAKDGANMANARKITMADGKQVFAGSSGEVAP